MEDDRFSRIRNDPTFRRIPKGQSKVKIDKRFQSMFKNKQFKVKYTTDKRGRPVNHTSTEDLKRYYHQSSEDESSSGSNDVEAGKFVKAPIESSDEADNELQVKQKFDKSLPAEVKKKLKNLSVDYARGESKLCSESSSDDAESEDELSESEAIDHRWGELDADAERTEEATYRLAACNMDWDRIRSIDLMVLFNSFLSAGGTVKSVAIYPSEFGKARMKEEDIKGPIELVDPSTVENAEDNEEGSNYHMEKLRQYQLNRLKYYYAVITFDTANSANKVYTECDGMEYESSAIKLDLRFIPDDMQFTDAPKELCDKLPEVNKYHPRFFTTTALQQAKVDLTWDETNPNRLELAQKLSTGNVEDVSQADLHNYLASSSGEDESESERKSATSDNDDEGKDVVEKYKALLQDLEQKEAGKNKNDLEMEISWGIGLKKQTDKLVKDKLNSSEEKTPFQQYLEKRKEKRKEKKAQRKNKMAGNDEKEDSDIPSDIDMSDPYFAEEFNTKDFRKPKKQEQKLPEDRDTEKQAELELLLMNDDDQQHFNLKKIQDKESQSKRKRKEKKDSTKTVTETIDNFQLNVNDDRFSALYTSHHFNIDPTDPQYKKTKGMEVLVNEKLKRRTTDLEDDVEATKQKKPKNSKSIELGLLVKSVKRKTQAYSSK